MDTASPRCVRTPAPDTTAQCVNCGHRVTARAGRPDVCPNCMAVWTDNPGPEQDGHVHFRSTWCDCAPCDQHRVKPTDVRWILRGETPRDQLTHTAP